MKLVWKVSFSTKHHYSIGGLVLRPEVFFFYDSADNFDPSIIKTGRQVRSRLFGFHDLPIQ
jgi:hypothetical protein